MSRTCNPMECRHVGFLLLNFMVSERTYLYFNWFWLTHLTFQFHTFSRKKINNLIYIVNSLVSAINMAYAPSMWNATNNLVYVRKKIVNVVALFASQKSLRVILKLNLIRRSMPSEFEWYTNYSHKKRKTTQIIFLFKR